MLCARTNTMQRTHDVYTTSPQRRCTDVASILLRRCLNASHLLGSLLSGCTDIEVTLYKRQVPAGMLLFCLTRHIFIGKKSVRIWFFFPKQVLKKVNYRANIQFQNSGQERISAPERSL